MQYTEDFKRGIVRTLLASGMTRKEFAAKTKITVPHDTVIDELRKVASLYGDENGELSMAMAVYMLGFNTYMGFGDKMQTKFALDSKDGMLKRIYEYAKNLQGQD